MGNGTTKRVQTGASHSVVVTAEQQGPGLYEVYLAPVHPAGGETGSTSKAGMVMVDPGSDTNFVRHDFAAALGLLRETCQFNLQVVNREACAIDTARYLLQLEDKDSNYHEVLAMGLDEITTLPPDPDLSPVQSSGSTPASCRSGPTPREGGHPART